MFGGLLEYVRDDKLAIIVNKDYVDVTNYKEVVSFDDYNVKLLCKDFILCIVGSNLTIKKLINAEILIIGDIKSVVFN